MKDKLRYSGIALILLGTLVLMVSYFCGWTEHNWILGTALLMITIGIVAHIFVLKKS